MKKAAAIAIASIINEEELNEDYIIPGAFDKRVAESVAKKVAEVAIETNVSKLSKDEVYI